MRRRVPDDALEIVVLNSSHPPSSPPEEAEKLRTWKGMGDGHGWRGSRGVEIGEWLKPSMPHTLLSPKMFVFLVFVFFPIFRPCYDSELCPCGSSAALPVEKASSINKGIVHYPNNNVNNNLSGLFPYPLGRSIQRSFIDRIVSREFCAINVLCRAIPAPR